MGKLWEIKTWFTPFTNIDNLLYSLLIIKRYLYSFTDNGNVLTLQAACRSFKISPLNKLMLKISICRSPIVIASPSSQNSTSYDSSCRLKKKMRFKMCDLEPSLKGKTIITSIFESCLFVYFNFFEMKTNKNYIKINEF